MLRSQRARPRPGGSDDRRRGGTRRVPSVTARIRSTPRRTRSSTTSRWRRSRHEQQAAAAPAAPAQPDYMAELEQLAQLKAQGIISEEEFEAKKKQLLGI